MKIPSVKKILNATAKRGWRGRRAQVEALIPFGKAEKDMTKEERAAYMARFNQMYPNCSEVQLHALWCARIGEVIPRCVAATIDCDADIQNNIVHIFVPHGKKCNSRLMTIMGRRISIINQENAEFWKSVLMGLKGGARIQLWKYYLKYADRTNDLVIPPEITENLIVLSGEEFAEAEEKMQPMGLHQPFVCISSRDSAYLEKSWPGRDWAYHDYRDSEIAACSKAAEYLERQGIQTVRMGRYVKNRVDFSFCIDYANDYYDELLDIALPKLSKFCLCDGGGINAVPFAMGIPLAMKNLVPLNGAGWGSFPQSDKGLFICKKYFLKAENRYMSIREMLELEARGGERIWYAEFYLENGIEVVENTAEDILGLVKEMNERLDGTWVETEESVQMQEKVQKMLYDDIIRTGKEYKACLHCKISINFLKHNPFLLDP